MLKMLSCAALISLTAVECFAQTSLPPATIQVDGAPMRFVAAGLEQRKPRQPVVVLEAGAADPAGSTLDDWAKALPVIARIAPVVAYERRGYGMSQPDRQRPTMRRVATVLHDLLRTAHIDPPYVLVGHSWGGNYIRAFTDLYPGEVAGLVFVDAHNGMGPWREERAAVMPPERRAAALKPPVIPPIPPNTPPGVRAEFEEIAREMISDGQEARTFKRVTGIPIAIIVATPGSRLQGDMGPVVRLQIDRALDMALAAPNGMLITANHVGHGVQNADPTLVANVIKHVLDHAAAPRSQ